jgi:UDP-glucose 4-epimerase
MKILVTGGAGFIGSNLIKRLISEGHDVHSFDNYEIGTQNNHIEDCNYILGDIEQLLYWRGDKFDICFHLAALSRIQPSFKDPTETFRVNTYGSQVVAEWATHNNVKVIYAGSSSKWDDPYQSPYACFKHMGEEIFKLYKKVYNLNAEICRFYNVYGPGEVIDGDWAAVIGIWRRQVRDGLPITIVGDGEQRRDFTHVDDIVDALIKIGFDNKRHEDAWELGTGINYSINEVYEMFNKKFNIEKIHISDQNGNYRETIRQNDDAIKILGWNPSDKLKQYINSL